MNTARARKIVAVGEAMLEMSPVEGGLFRLDYAGDTFNTLWHAAQLLGTGKTETARLCTYVRDERPWGGNAPPAAWNWFSAAQGG